MKQQQPCHHHTQGQSHNPVAVRVPVPIFDFPLLFLGRFSLHLHPHVALQLLVMVVVLLRVLEDHHCLVVLTNEIFLVGVARGQPIDKIDLLFTIY